MPAYPQGGGLTGGRLLVAAGEASGDRLLAELVAELRARRPDVEVRGVVGALGRAAGVSPIADADALTVIGFKGVPAALPAIGRTMRRVVRCLDAWRPDLLLTVDSPDAMLMLCRAARRRGVPAIHWVSPQVWAWRPGRVRRVATAVDALLCLFPMEPPLYASLGVRAVLVGHPVVDRVRPTGRVVGAGPLVALLPGSRRREIAAHWPVLVDVAARLRARVPGVRFVVPVASSVDPSALGGLDDAARVGSVQDVSAADVAVVCSGTATLELAVLGVPMVLVYQASTIDWAIGSRLALVRSVGLPNLVAGDTIVPEHVQDLDAERITDDAVRLLGVDGDVQRAALRGVVARLGGPGAVGRAADEVERWLPGGRREP